MAVLEKDAAIEKDRVEKFRLLVECAQWEETSAVADSVASRTGPRSKMFNRHGLSERGSSSAPLSV